MNCPKKALVDEIILEEAENLVTETLRKAVKDKLNDRLSSHVTHGKWDKCFDVAKELIAERSPPTESTPLLAEPSS